MLIAALIEEEGILIDVSFAFAAIWSIEEIISNNIVEVNSSLTSG